MPWFAQQGGGNTPVLRKAAKPPGPGWILVPGATDSMTLAQAEAQVAADILHGDFGGGIGTGVSHAVGAVANATGVATPFRSVTDFLNSLQNPQLWLRLAEGALGIILIATAVSKMTGAGSAIGKAARKVPLVV